MLTSSAFSQKSYAVFGLARTGLSVVSALQASGAEVVAWDDSEATRAKADATLVDLNAADLAGFDGLVVSPGVPLHIHPLTRRARDAGVPVIGDIELFAQARPSLPPHRVVGVTGTNGKSTTTALIHHLLVSAGRTARLGGNIGLPILAQDPLPEGGVYVLELSSFQIDLTTSLDCDVAVLLNLTPDHLDRHGDMEGYAAAKARLFAMQSSGAVAVIAQDDEYARDISTKVKARLVPVSASQRLEQGVSVVGGLLTIDARVIAEQADWPSLQGPHNAQNAAAAVAAVQALGVDVQAIIEGLRSYGGLPHRMERVAERNGVLFVNDSKATNPTSTAPALGAYPAIHWIAGGRAKTDELNATKPFLTHVRAAYLVGEAQDLFARLLDRHIPVIRAGTVENATRLAAQAAQPGEVVLLSPACASYDQFTDFEARGAAFREAVRGLPS